MTLTTSSPCDPNTQVQSSRVKELLATNMPYFTDQHTFLHQSSLLIQAYPSTRTTTKYSLPRKPNTKAKSKPKESREEDRSGATDATSKQAQPKRERSAQLTLKTFHPESGICLKYRTDKAAEVGRLLNGLGRLAKGEVIEMPTAAAAAAAASFGADGDRMDVDGGAGVGTAKVEEKTVTAAPAATQTQGTAGSTAGGGGGKGKKKKGKK